MTKKIYKEYKYKHLLNVRENPYYNDLRILKFKRPKWNFLKKNIQRQATKFFFFRKYQKNQKKLYFYNQKGYSIASRWSNIRYRYKELIIAKRKFILFFLLKTKIKALKQLIKNCTSTKFLIQIETRLDILLWRVGLFSTPAISRFFINHNNIEINGNKVNLNSVQFKKGDIITFSPLVKHFVKEKFNHIKKLKPKTANNKFVLFNNNINQFIPYYVLINWDTLELICINNISEINIDYMSHMYIKKLNSTLVKNYLRLQ